jgi:hypothetical protein
MRKLSKLRFGLVLLVVATVMAWWGLERWEPRAEWLRIEAPRIAVAGQSLPIRVHLTPLAEPAFLSADLHWGTSRDRPKGYFATGGTRAVGAGGGTFDFAVPIQPKDGLRYVNGVIFLSRTGSWESRTLVAVTGVIPVTTNAANWLSRLYEWAARPLSSDPGDHPRPAAFPRLLIALVFLAAAVAALAIPTAGKIFPELLALACLWELLGLEDWLGTQARAMARAGDFYYPRAVFQKVTISLVLAALVVFLLFLRRAPKAYRLLLGSFGLYLAIAAVNLVSWHQIDTIAGLSWHGLLLVQALKLVCAACTLRGVQRASNSLYPSAPV